MEPLTENPADTGTPVPVLGYATPVARPRGADLFLARQIAVEFAIWNFGIGFVWTIIILLGVNFSNWDMGIDGVNLSGLSAVNFIATSLSYGLLFLSCWIRLLTSKNRLKIHRSVPFYAGAYSLLLFLCLGFGFIQWVEPLGLLPAVGWMLIAPIGCAFVLLGKPPMV